MARAAARWSVMWVRRQGSPVGLVRPVHRGQPGSRRELMTRFWTKLSGGSVIMNSTADATVSGSIITSSARCHCSIIGVFMAEGISPWMRAGQRYSWASRCMIRVSIARAALEELYAAASVPTVMAEMEITLTTSAGNARSPGR